MKIITTLPMKFDLSKPGLNEFLSQNVKKVHVSSRSASTAVGGQAPKASQPLAAGVERAIRSEINLHRESAKNIASKIGDLRTWQNRLTWPMGAAGVALGALSVAILANPVATLMGSALLVVSGHTALLATAGVLLGVVTCLLVAKASLEVAIYFQQKKCDGAQAYADRLAAELGQNPAA